MRNLFILAITALTLFAMSAKQQDDNKTVDDWDYNITAESFDKNLKSRSMPMSASVASPMMKMSADSLGFSVGGAKDADNFYENIKNGYLPKVSSITYEGVFYDHYFKTEKKEECKDLFCPSYTTYKRENPYAKEEDFYISVGLNSNIKASDFKRKKLNIVVVLDISGSMNSSFDSYYYDKNKDANEPKVSKMQVANESLVSMINHLGDDDRLGVVLFDNQAYSAKPLRLIKYTDIGAIKKHILDLKSRGGTNWSEGYKKGVTLFDTIEDELKNKKTYENRVIFLTDAMPNRGELKEEGLFGLVDKASKEGIYTTFIGVGVDFNNDLVEAVSKTKGANYFAVHSADEFKKRLDEEFDFMVTPLVFDLSLKLTSSTNKIEAVYGSPDANKATGEVMYVNTLFPSQSEDGAVKGGIVLIKTTDAKNLTLSVSYKDRSGKSYENVQKISFDKKYTAKGSGIEKAILLTDYVTLMQNWMIDMREGCQDKVIKRDIMIPLAKRSMIYPPDRPSFEMLESWERKSCSLKVSQGYKKLLSIFEEDFTKKAKSFEDDKFEKELDALKALLSSKTKPTNDVIDDWNSKR